MDAHTRILRSYGRPVQRLVKTNKNGMGELTVSTPVLAVMAGSWATKTASAVLDQPPVNSHFVQTSDDGTDGALTQMGIKKPVYAAMARAKRVFCRYEVQSS